MTGVNIHIYPSDFRSESRIVRTAQAIAGFETFSHIHLIGARDRDLPDREVLSGMITLHRLGPRKDRFRSRLTRPIWLVLWSLSTLWFCIRQPLICLNCHSLPVLPLSALIRWLKSCKLVYDAHELETETGYSKGIRKWLARRLERRFIHSCDAHIFVARAISDWYQARYKLIDPLVIYNVPSAPKDFRAQPKEGLRQRLSIPSSQRIALYQGLLGHGRGIESLIEAVEEQTDICVVFLGFGPLEDKVARIAKQSSAVYFHPRVRHEELLALTASADFGLSLIEPVSLSYEYCMPNKLFEYMLAGLPVIVSPTQEQRRLVERYGAGIVADSCSPIDTRVALKRAITADRDTMVAGCRMAMKDYSWDRQVDKLRVLYAGLTKRPH